MKAAAGLCCDGCWLLLPDDTRRYLEYAAGSLPPEVAQEVRYAIDGENACAQVFASQVPLVVDDVSGGRFAEPVLAQQGITSAAFVPVSARWESLGVLGVFAAPCSQCSREELIERAQLLAGQIALFVHSSRLLSASQRRTRELAALLRTARAVSDAVKPDEVLRAVAGQLAELLSLHKTAVLLWDAGQQVLRAAASHNVAAKGYEGLELKLGEGVSGEAALRRDIVCVTDYAVSGYMIPGFEDEQSVLAAPILAGDELLGVLVGADASRARRFDAEDRAVVAAFAAQAAAAIQHARLFQRLNQSLEELERGEAALLAQHQRMRHQQRELWRINQELERAMRLTSEFVANMSHELRTPINAILGYAHLFGKGAYGDLREEGVAAVEGLKSSAESLLGMVDEVLELARIESGAVPLTMEECSAADLVEEAAATARGLLTEGTVEVVAEAGADVPTLLTDRGKLKRILHNLVTNAAKFTSHGRIIITAGKDSQRGLVIFSVQDTGIGIRGPDLRVVFEKFRQVDGTPSRRYGGAGLGLHIVRTLAEVLGGRVEAKSQYGKGSTFTLWIPARLKGAEAAVSLPSRQARRGVTLSKAAPKRARARKPRGGEAGE